MDRRLCALAETGQSFDETLFKKRAGGVGANGADVNGMDGTRPCHSRQPAENGELLAGNFDIPGIGSHSYSGKPDTMTSKGE